jgi:hypothetical protein
MRIQLHAGAGSQRGDLRRLRGQCRIQRLAAA